jgi:mannosyltransferase OCH1-like enzyme
MTLAPQDPELHPSDIAKSDELRSQVVKQLISANLTSLAARKHQTPPRLLVQFWDDSKSIPEDVQRCINSWLPLEKLDFKRLIFDDGTASKFIREELGDRYGLAFARRQHPAMRSDYFRLCFMLKSGAFTLMLTMSISEKTQTHA